MRFRAPIEDDTPDGSVDDMRSQLSVLHLQDSSRHTLNPTTAAVMVLQQALDDAKQRTTPDRERSHDEQCRLLRRIHRYEKEAPPALFLADIEQERQQWAQNRRQVTLKQLEEHEKKAVDVGESERYALQSRLIQEQTKVLNQVENIRRKAEQTRKETEREFSERQTKQLQILKQTLKDVYERELAVQKKKEEQRKTEEAERLKLEEDRRRAEETQRKLLAERQRQEDEAKSKLAAEEQKRRAEQEQKAKQKEANAVVILKNYGSSEAMEEAKLKVAKVREVKETIDRQVKSNRDMLKEGLRYRMQFTTKVGAVTNSRRHVQQFYKDINDLLNKGKAISELMYKWLLNNLAKQFVKQAETEVAVNFKKVFPLSTLCLLLVNSHPDLLDFVLGRLYKKCTYLVPCYVKREQGESDDDVRKRAGMKMRGQAWETEEQLHERINGMVAFYSALVQTDLRSFQQSNPFTMAQGWKYVARLLNMTPRKITLTLLETIFKIMGHALVRDYRNQAHKLIRFVRMVYMPMLQGSDGPKVRLELLFDAYAKRGTFEPFEGTQLQP